MIIKKTIALILACMLLLTGIDAFAKETLENSSKFEQNIKLLKAVGIDVGFTDENKSITREGLANLAIKITGIQTEKAISAKFIDVPLKHYAADVVYTVDKAGYMTGFDDNTFRLEQEATNYELSRILLYMLGYGYLASNENWTEADFNTKSRNVRLLKGVSGLILTEGNALIMMRNMLKTPVLAVDYNSNFSISNDRTYLSEFCSVEYETGTLEATWKDSVLGSSTVKKGTVQISGQQYLYNEDISQYLGYKVKFYVAETDNNHFETIVYLDVVMPGEELVIQAYDIESYSGNYFNYYDGNIIRSRYINKSKAIVIVNGCNIQSFNEQLLMPEAGNVKLVDYEGDNTIDAVFVNTKMYYNLSQVLIDDYAFFEDDLKCSFSVDEDGLAGVGNSEGLAIDALTRGAVVSMAPGSVQYSTVGTITIPEPAKTQQNVDFEIIEETFEGTVIGMSDSEIKIKTDDEEKSIKLSKWYMHLVDAGIYKKPQINSEITVFLDNDRVVYAKSNSIFGGTNRKYMYGYLIKAKRNRKGFESDICLRIFTENGIMEDYEIAKKFTVDGNRISSFDKFQSISKVWDSSANEIKQQLVAFSLTDDEKINKLFTAVDHITATDNPDYIAGYKGYDNNSFSIDYSSGGKTIQYRGGFKHLYTINSATKVFVVPKDSDDPRYFSVKPNSYLTKDNYYETDIYDVQENYVASACVLKVKKGISAIDIALELYPGNPSAIVIGKAQALDDEGEVRTQLRVMENEYPFKTGAPSGVVRELFAADEELISHNGSRYTGGIYPSVAFRDLEPGDVIMFKTNEWGEINTFRVIMRYKDLYDKNGNFVCKEINTTDTVSSMYNTCGKVVKIFDDYTFTFTVTGDNSLSGLRYCNKKLKSANYAVNIFDASKKNKDRVLSCTSAELRPGDCIVTRSESGDVKEVFIYRK